MLSDQVCGRILLWPKQRGIQRFVRFFVTTSVNRYYSSTLRHNQPARNQKDDENDDNDGDVVIVWWEKVLEILRGRIAYIGDQKFGDSGE